MVQFNTSHYHFPGALTKHFLVGFFSFSKGTTLKIIEEKLNVSTSTILSVQIVFKFCLNHVKNLELQSNLPMRSPVLKGHLFLVLS